MVEKRIPCSGGYGGNVDELAVNHKEENNFTAKQRINSSSGEKLYTATKRKF